MIALWFLALLQSRADPPVWAIQDRPSVRQSVSPSAIDWRPLARLVDSAVEAGAAPGAVVAISIGGVQYIHGTGRLGIGDTTRPDPATIYDLASLTKVIGLTTGLMLAVTEGRIELDAPVQRYVPRFTGRFKERVTIRHLLTHSSGLRDGRRLWQETPDAAAARALVDSTPLDTVPGARMVYSDLGAMILTRALEAAYQTRIDTLLATRVFGPLGLRTTRFLPPAEWHSRIAPTEDDPWRGRVLRAEVHDENAAWLGGVSGHAGLFSNAEDLLVFGEWLLRLAGGRAAGRADGNSRSDRPTDRPSDVPIDPAVAREFLRRQELVPGSSRALGWDTPSNNSSAGSRLSPGSWGHTGFTGTSIWTDPDRKLVIVLLTNRVNPNRQNNGHIALRRAVADMAAAIADASNLVDIWSMAHLTFSRNCGSPA
jgi:CubicO group peptidase (beta-lactamase class C family)